MVTTVVADMVTVEVEVTLRLTFGRYVLVSSTSLGPMTRFYFFFSFARKLLCSSFQGVLSDEKMGL
jgi:hypothetical protein